MSHALIVGKFYPPHAGHHHLIDLAIAECDRVTVAAVFSSVENIPVRDRVAWIYDAHGGPSETFEVISFQDDTPVEYTDETWNWFLDALMDALDHRCAPESVTEHQSYPDIVYSGENYAPEFARRLFERYDERVFRDFFPAEVTYRKVDRTEVVDISATKIRAHPERYWDYLRPATRAGLCKRIVVCGAESTGTTTLAKHLAEYYETAWVPEFGRSFYDAVGSSHIWTDDDFHHIAQEQKRWEDHFARHTSNGVLICDTDEFATAMFSEVYLSHQTPGILDLARATPADLYIVTSPTQVIFEDDGTRTHPDTRDWMTRWFIENLPEGRWIYSIGSKRVRLRDAIPAVDIARKWHIADPMEYRDPVT